MELYRTVLKVRPATSHPLYWDWQFGFLLVWLLSDSADGVGQRVVDIVELLPYEIVGSDESAPVLVSRIEKPSEKLEYREKEDAAKQLGISLFLVAAQTGVDEGDFEMEPFV